MARQSLKGTVKRPDPAEAAEAAKRIMGQGQEPEAEQEEASGELETVSYNLPIELIELCRELADLRLKNDRAERRRAKKAGQLSPRQARRSASRVVVEALEAYRGQIEAEISELRERKS